VEAVHPAFLAEGIDGLFALDRHEEFVELFTDVEGL